MPVTVRPEPENSHVEFKIPKTEHKIPEGHERPHSVSGISGYQSAMRAAKESAHHEFGTEAPLPLDDFSIIKETDKAYAIHNPHYDPQPSGYYGRHRAAKGESFDNDKYIWIPKGHATTEGEGDKKQIASLSSWIAKEKGISTHESNKRNAEIEKTKSELQSSANDRYTKLVEHAKQSGIKGARSGMRTSTLLEKYKEAGIEPPKEYQEGGLKEIAQSAPETKYRDIPGRGKGVVLNVPFAEKEAAKEHGARWSPDLKKWYFPEGTDFPEDLKQYRHDSLTRADAESDYSDEEVESMNTENLSPKDLIVYHLRKLANQ